MRSIACLLGLLVLAGCAGQHIAPSPATLPVAHDYTDFANIVRPTPDTKPPVDSVLYFLHGDSDDIFTYRLLVLMPGGHYSLTSGNRDLHIGASVGTWAIDRDQLVLKPFEEEGELKTNPIRRLDMILHRGWLDGNPKPFDELLLVQVESKDKFLATGPSAWTCFHRPGFGDQSFKAIPGRPRL